MLMSLKVVIGVGAALVVGLLAGFVLGRLGRGELEVVLHQAKQRALEADESMKRMKEESEVRERACRTAKHLLLSKEALLRASTELLANNYGLTSQHLAQARSWLKAAERDLKPREAKVARELFNKTGDAQTLAMRLDPMARVFIDKILAEVQKLPGAR